MPFSPEHYDFVDETELRTEHLHNHALLEAKYLEDLSVFRASVFTKLRLHNALSNSHGWAIFRKPQESPDGDVAIYPTPLSILVWVEPITVNNVMLPVPNIRILINEEVRRDVGVPDVMTMDYIAAGTDSTWFHLDAVDRTSDSVQESLGTLIGTDDNGALAIYGPRVTPSVSWQCGDLRAIVMGDASPHTSIAPLGLNLLEDKIHALTAMKEAFSLVGTLEPVFSCQTSE